MISFLCIFDSFIALHKFLAESLIGVDTDIIERLDGATVDRLDFAEDNVHILRCECLDGCGVFGIIAEDAAIENESERTAVFVILRPNDVGKLSRALVEDATP